MYLFIFTLFFSLLFPKLVFAWGPATHLILGTEILNNITLITKPLQQLLTSFPNDFLYGCIAADITVGKKFIEYIHHCHNWKVGLKVLENSQSLNQKAFAYGYLSHLAADTIAHNYYVPYQMLATFPTKLLRHTYWELRFDRLAPASIWQLAQRLIREHNRSPNDELLDQILKTTLFSFKTNRKIFNSLILFQNLKNWHRLIIAITQTSQWLLIPQEIKEYKKLSLDAILDFLKNREQAASFQLDPSGYKILDYAKKERKRLKKSFGGKSANPKKIAQILSSIKGKLKKGLFKIRKD